MDSLQVGLFGKICIQYDGQDITPTLAAKVQELFCYLLLYRDRPHTREALADRLWRNASADQSKKYLRQTLWQLQAALDKHPDPSQAALLTLDNSWIHLNDADLWLDVQIFEQAFAAVRSIPDSDLDEQQVQKVREAVALYQGDLLSDWYQDWCVFERERLQSTYFALLDKLMNYCLAHRRYEEGLAYGTLILRHEPTREPTHQRLMVLHSLSGNRTAALRQYQRCKEILATELEVQPTRQTVVLYEQIRADQLVEPARVSLEPTGPGTVKPLLSGALEQLLQIQANLASLQNQVHYNIEAFKRLLDSEA
jgi:DNA-binding SARP family transcriptional activator